MLVRVSSSIIHLQLWKLLQIFGDDALCNPFHKWISLNTNDMLLREVLSITYLKRTRKKRFPWIVVFKWCINDIPTIKVMWVVVTIGGRNLLSSSWALNGSKPKSTRTITGMALLSSVTELQDLYLCGNICNNSFLLQFDVEDPHSLLLKHIENVK